RQRQHAVDNRLELSAENAPHHIEKLSMTADRGSENLNLPEEDLPKIRLRSKAGRGAAREHAASTARGAQAADPRVRTNIVHDHIDAALVRELADLFVKLIGGVVNQKVCADICCALQFLAGACRCKDAASHHLRDLYRCRTHAAACAKN